MGEQVGGYFGFSINIFNYLFLMSEKSQNSISAFDFKKKLQSKKPPQILDIRTDEEFEDFNFGGIHIELEVLLNDLSQIAFLKKKPAIIICYTGLQSEIVRTILTKKGFDKLMNLEGGIEAYLAL
jgi:rhodanese-related sulfurtransferase